MKALLHAFEDNFSRGCESGAAVCVWQNGEEIAYFCGGEAREGVHWTPRTLVPVFSATKAAAASCLLLALYDCCQGPELEVGDIWPTFPLPHATVGQLLSHQCGLAALGTPASLFDLEACRAAVEHSTPAWAPPQHGYHPHTFGPLVDILMRELCGQRVCDFWEQRIRRPLGLDFYIAHIPESEFPRIAHLQTARLNGRMPRNAFYERYFKAGSDIHRAFHSITGPDSAREMNTPQAWNCGCPAKGGIASARGLAMFYQALLGHLPASPYPGEVQEWLGTPQCSGQDLTLLCPTSFTCGAMCEPASLFGHGGFGHAGAGGSHAFCEPGSGLSFAYVMNRMELGILPGGRVARLLAAL